MIGDKAHSHKGHIWEGGGREGAVLNKIHHSTKCNLQEAKGTNFGSAGSCRDPQEKFAKELLGSPLNFKTSLAAPRWLMSSRQEAWGSREAPFSSCPET